MAGRLGRIGEPSSSSPQSGSSSGGRLGRIEVSKQVLEDEEKRKRQEEAKKRIEKSDAEVKKSQDAVLSPASIFGDVVKAAGNATAAVNEKVLGGAVKAGAKVFNTVTSGFNNDEANKKTDAFLKSSKQVNDKGQSTLATGHGVDRNAESFKVGEDVGDLIKSNTVDAVTSPLKGLKSVVDQAKMSADIQSKSSGIGRPAIDKLIKFVDEDEKAGKLTKTQADAKRKHLNEQADKTTTAVSEAEKKSGVAFDQTAGVTNLLSTAAEVAGLKGLPKAAIDKVVGSGVPRDVANTTKKAYNFMRKDSLEGFSKKADDTSSLLPSVEEGQFKGTFLDPRKVEVGGVSNGAEEVGVRTPVRPGIRQESSAYNVKVRTPQPLTDEAYTKRFNNLSKSYDKEVKSLEGKPPLTQKVASDAIDKKYSNLMGQLDDEYKNGVMPKRTILSKISKSTSKAEKTTGGAPKTGINAVEEPVIKPVRANNYVPSDKPRIAKEEATKKLKDAGYTTNETVEILSDALPDKGLSMPGSPKNIGLNDSSVSESAKNFDQQNSGTVPNGSGGNLTPLASIDGAAEKGTSRLASSVQEKAIQEKIISKTEAENTGINTYNKANMKQQAEYATDLIRDDPQSAIDIAMGRKAPPEHILPQMVYNAVEDHAMKIGGEKGGRLLKDLSNSKQVSDLTVMAQNVRAAAERDPHSPVTLMQEVKLARAEAAKKRGKIVSEVEKEDIQAVKKVTLKVKKEDWESFIKGLEC